MSAFGTKADIPMRPAVGGQRKENGPLPRVPPSDGSRVSTVIIMPHNSCFAPLLPRPKGAIPFVGLVVTDSESTPRPVVDLLR